MPHYWGWPESYIYIVHDRMFGNFPDKKSVCNLYIPINVWFWPTVLVLLQVSEASNKHLDTS